MAAEGAAGPREGRRPHRRNGGVDGLEPMLGRLAENPARLTASGLWKALRPDERALAAEYFLEDKGTDRNALVTMVALTRRARPETVRKWSNAKLAGGMKTAFSLEAKLASSLLEQLHMTGRRAMLGRFLDLLGARSREGLPDSADKIAAKEHEVHAAADRLMAEYGVHNVVVYFLVLALRRASVADHLWSWMRRLGNGKAPEAAVAEQGAASQAGVVGASPPPSSRAARTARSRASGTTSVRASRIPPSGARGAKPGRASGTKLDRGLRAGPEDASSDVQRRGLRAGLEDASSAVPHRGSPAGLEDAASAVPHRDPPTGPDDASSAIQRRGLSAGSEPASSAGPEDAASASKLLSPADAARPRGEAADAGSQRPLTSMTSLDRLLIQAILDAAQGVSGALSRDEVDRAVEEFVRLNGRRALSYYHAGFRDTVFGESPAPEGPALDRDGKRFYWAGAIQGWARTRSWPSIVREYDGRDVVRDLGDGSDFASAEAVEPTVRALTDEGRLAELARFVRMPALSGRLELYELLLNTAIGRLRAKDAQEARPVLDLLVKAAEAMEGDGESARAPLFLEARRRQAQCLRQLNERHGAEAALRALLKLELDEKMKSLVKADLGLVASGFSALWEVRLPLAQDDLETIVEKLSLGEEHFRAAAAEDVAEASHGRYCLGVLAVARAAEGGAEALGGDDYREALEHLSKARSAFLGRRERYASICPDADLYLGVASIGNLSREGLAQGPQIMVEGMKAGAKLPPYLVAPLVDAMEFADQDAQRLVYNTVVRAEDDSMLDIAAASEPVLEHCRSAVEALQARGRKRNRPGDLAAADLRAALHGRVANGEHEAAAELLNDLESLAQRGAGAEELAELLSDPARYEPAWSREDAAMALAHSHESQGRYDKATEILRDYFHQYASQGTEAGLHDAYGILQKIKQFGIDQSIYKDMQDRYDALASSSAQVEAEADHDERPEVKVLIVGGNEVQARAEEQVRKKLHRTHPHVRVEFIHTGWGSNWQKPLEEFVRKLPVFDAVVIMRFMRTELGKRIRRACVNHPWRSCWGPGQMAQVEAAIKASEAASPMRRPGR